MILVLLQRRYLRLQPPGINDNLKSHISSRKIDTIKICCQTRIFTKVVHNLLYINDSNNSNNSNNSNARGVSTKLCFYMQTEGTYENTFVLIGRSFFVTRFAMNIL